MREDIKKIIVASLMQTIHNLDTVQNDTEQYPNLSRIDRITLKAAADILNRERLRIKNS